MQYKRILSILLLTAAFLPLRAQQHAVNISKAPLQASKTDTATAAKKSPLIAGNMPASPKDGGKYNHVPLAGEKSYFGDKNDYVNDFTRKYLELHNRTLGSVQNVSATPFSVIDNVLEQKNLPKELKYIAVIESALNHNAVSSAGAVGTWQLMEATARMLGLSVNRHKDERRDLYKSTNAATKYLELLYGELDDWLLVIAAYNSGPTPVQRAIQLTGSRNFWDIKQYLPQETQGYVLAFIATASIFENLNKFISLGSVPVDFKFGKEDEVLAPVPPLVRTDANAGALIVKKSSTTITDEEMKNMAMVRVTEPLDLEYTAQELGIDKNLLKRWNSDFDQFILKTYPTPFYNLRIPKEKLQVFLQKKDQITKKSSAIFSANR
jgi:membrane-bound lytic murein transglycosylase D